MPQEVDLRKMVCPSCGAPVQLATKSGKCDYCGHVLERPDDPKQQPQSLPQPVFGVAPPVQVQWSAAEVPPLIQPARSSGSCVGIIVMLVIFAFVGVGILVPLLAGGGFLAAGELFGGLTTLVPEISTVGSSGPIFSPFHISNGPAILLSPGDGLPPDVVVSAFNSSDSSSGLLYLAGEPPALSWESPPLNASYGAPLFVGSSQLYVGSETDLVALNRADGRLLWQASLSDQIYSHICQDCLQEVGQHVVALANDGTLQAFNAQSGELAWSQQLEAQPRQLVVFNGQVGVLDEAESSEADFLIFDPATGTLVQRLSPRCPSEPFPDDPQGPGIYSTVFFDPAGQALYFFGGFFEPGCIQRWDATNRTATWQATFPVNMVREQDDDLFTPDAVYLSDGSNLVAVNTADGIVRQLGGDENYNLVPLAAQAGVLLVQASRSRGSTRDELWVIDATTGERRWQFVPQATRLMSPSSDTVTSSDEGYWNWHITPAGVVVLQARSEPYRLVVETLNWNDGASSGQVTIPLEVATPYSVHVIGGNNSKLWLQLDGGLTVLDLATATIVSTWP
ncbi:MAG: PQQ-binding-like beta-propeller repeat protein [Chloroflexi bacterium]|nr:PQQ-binding-like beta-propeller repeat protein [Chloroflexota bacterium]MCI0577496.1 PQQ-binding-like beta-propeller repeat protein [Chloroflexota bacterium]MCI0647687.1 PQQ-binding-like beta-propeller repeat protein [Chloroflexota bacterium]MCI0730117.1 PQQ-binding-like beta-propeller repeat protein [Chloroflexota bacterium]